MVKIFLSIKELAALKKLWAGLYLVKLFIAAVFLLPLFITLNASLATSHFSLTILKEWDLAVVVELLSARGDTAVSMVIVLFCGLLVYAVIMQLANGGLYYLMVSGQYRRTDWGRFFAECGLNFGTHVRISLLMSLVYILLMPGVFFFANLVGLVFENSGGELSGPVVWIKPGLIFLVMLAASIFSDSARAAAAANPEYKLKQILSQAADFYRPRMIRLVGIFLLTYAVFIVLWLAVEWTAAQAVETLGGLPALMAELVLFQCAAAARTGQKLWYLTHVGKIYRDYNPGRFRPVQAELELE